MKDFGGSLKTKYIALISAGHQTLPLAELKALLDTDHIDYTVTQPHTGLVLVETDRPIEPIITRASMTKTLYRYLFKSKGDVHSIRQKLTSTDISKHIDTTSFSVRVNKAPTLHSKQDSLKIESLIGQILKDKLGLRVDLKKPQTEFQGFLLKNGFLFGLTLFNRPKKIFAERQPTMRPRFHPATLIPSLARCMVNLARTKPDHLLLDSFCGVGGILIEAGLIGCKVVGIDAQKEMCYATLENLKHYQLHPMGIICADSLKTPLQYVDSVVTDPPYGTAATTLKRTLEKLMMDFLSQCASLLRNKGYVCIAAPQTIKLPVIGADAGLILVETHRIYVHRSLTREIVVFRKE